ncbi:hypothetical protein JCM11957_01470 [Caminibacter profundus]
MFEWLLSDLVTASLNLITLLGVGFNIAIFLSEKKKEKTIIDIILKVEDKKYKAKYPLLRKFVKRSEIKGVLRDLLVDQHKGFSLKYLSDEKFIKNVIDIQKGKGKEIIIECTKEEFEIFNEENFIVI